MVQINGISRRAAAVTLALAAGVSVFGAQSKAAVLLNDTFDTYTTGALVGQGGWTQTGTTATNPIQVTNPSGTNQVASFIATGQDVYEAFSGQQILHTDGASVETSLAVNVTSVSTNGDYFSHLGDSVGTTTGFFQRLAVKAATGGYVLGIESTAGTGSAFTYGTTAFPFGTAENVDIVWNFVAGAMNDTFDVTVNGTPYLTAVSWLSTSVAEPTAIQEANIRQGSGGPVGTIDNYEVQGISTAIPEPTSLGLVGVGALLLGRRRRRA